MVQQEFQNIEELEADEARQASEAAIVPSLNNFLLNVLSDQVKVLMEFNPAYWPENASFESTS